MSTRAHIAAVLALFVFVAGPAHAQQSSTPFDDEADAGVDLAVPYEGVEPTAGDPLPVAAPDAAPDALEGLPSPPPITEVYVAGDRSGTAVRQSPYPVSVIDVKKYAGRATDLNELLDRTAGVKIRQSGGAGSASRVSIRGLEGRRVAIFIDGHPLHSPDGNFGINDLPLQLIDRIEIYKGVVPAKLGGDGLGSAINVVLRERQRSYADLGYSYGSYDTHRAFTFNKYIDDENGWSAALGAIANAADNDYLMPRPDGPPVRRRHDGFRSFLAGGNFELTRSWFDRAKLEFAIVLSRKEYQGIPDATGGGSAFEVREARYLNHTLFAGLELEKDELLPGLDVSYDLRVPYFRSNFRDLARAVFDFDGERLPNPNGRGEVGRGPNDSRNWRLDIGQRINVNYAFSATQALNLNSELQRSFDHPDDPVADAAAGVNVSPYPGELFRSITGLSHEGKFFDDRLIEIVGIKHFHLWSRGTLTSRYDLYVEEPGEVSQDEQRIGWNAALRYRVWEPFMLKGSYEHAARLPSAEELFGDGFTIQGSTRLTPESSDNLTAGFYLDHRFDEGWRVQAELTGFMSWVRDLIVLGGTFTPNYANVGKVHIRGIEADVKLDLARFLYVYANVTYQDLRNASETLPGSRERNYLKGLRVPNTPSFFANWGAELYGRWFFGERSKTRLFYDASFVDEFFYEYEVSSNQNRRLPRQLTHTLGVQQSWEGERYSLNFEIDNLTDAREYDEFNTPLPGRTFRILARMTFL